MFDYYLNRGKVFLNDSSQKQPSDNEVGLRFHRTVVSKILNILAKVGLGEGTLEIQNDKNQIKRVRIKDIKKLLIQNSPHDEKNIQHLKNKEELFNRLYSYHINKKSECLKAEAAKGDGKAAFSLGEIYLSKASKIFSGKLAIEQFKQAAAAGVNAEECNLIIGRLYKSGAHDLPPSNEKAKEYLQKAVNLGSTEAKILLKEVEQQLNQSKSQEKLLEEIWSPPPLSIADLTINDWEDVVICNNPTIKKQFIKALMDEGKQQTPFSKIIVYNNRAEKSDIFFDEGDGLLSNHAYLATKKEIGNCLVIFMPSEERAENRYLDRSYPLLLSDSQEQFKNFLNNQKAHFYVFKLEDQPLLKSQQLPKSLTDFIFRASSV